MQRNKCCIATSGKKYVKDISFSLKMGNIVFKNYLEN